MKIRSHKAAALIAFAAMFIITSPFAFAETTTEVEQELAAQIAINKLLKAQIRILEEEIRDLRSVVARDLGAPTLAFESPPEDAADGDGVLEQVLIQRGSTLLRPGEKQVSPSLSWSHSGSGASATDTVTAGLDARIGLPGNMMIGVFAPLVHGQTAFGGGEGLGSVSATVWKQIVGEKSDHPALVASLTYSAPASDYLIESGISETAFHALTARLSATKQVDPVAFYGDVFYSHAFERTIGGMGIQPADACGFNAGASLAATPGISLQAGIGVALTGPYQGLPESDEIIASVSLGAGFILAKGKYLAIGGEFGVTDDAPDLTLTASMPVRF